MGEIKSVKVDNWGVFFLQKLQNFFNKTDYCDLTLQFRDNSQLKVHRLVLSACTDYFNVLEQTCEVIDDALIMPNELQADVVVPIVNFMYTGTLEFELKMYGKLLRTAKEMNMTVLLKLLEAHRRTMENVNRAQRPPSPKAIRRRVQVTGQTSAMPAYQTQGAQGRRVLATNVAGGVGGNANMMQRRIVQTKTAGTNVSPVQIQYRQQIGSTSVVRTSTLRASNPNQQQTLQTYVKNEPMEYETFEGAGQTQPSSSPFEQLRKGYNNNKRPAESTFLSPPTKKPNLEDVKEFAEQQRMRKQIAAEYGEDQEFEGMMDDDIHNDDDDDEALLGNSVQSSALHGGNINTAVTAAQGATSSVASATITIKPESDSQHPQIIVKDHSGSKMDHAKIISEVLRQYPQLAKGNKNIKLKIMPSAQGQAQRIVIKKEGGFGDQQQQQPMQPQMHQVANEPIQISNQPQVRATPSHVIAKAGERISQQQFQQQTQLQATVAKPTVVSVQQPLVTTTNAATATSDNTQQKRRIDSKTMHALIALGAENTAGPWLCLRCGLNGRPISIPSYRGFRRHLINTHKEAIDPALCEHCGWRSQNNRELHFHVQIEHKIKTTLYTFPECLLCTELFLDTNALNQHMLDSHPSANKQQCIYCNKIFIKDMQLYTHLKLYHKHQAIEDGIIDVSEEDYSQQAESVEMEEHLESEQHEDEENADKKVKILSDISLPMASSIIRLDGNTLTADSNVIDAQTKFVTSDGNEMLLTDEQRKEIMSQLNQEHNNGGVVMVLNDAIFTGGDCGALEDPNSSGTAAQTAEVASTTATENVSEGEFDDSEIYAELASEKTEKEKQQEDAKEADESLKWAENLISEHDLSENAIESDTSKKHEEDKAKKEFITKKLKELTVDWSEDENEEDDEDLDKSGQTEELEINKEAEQLEEKIEEDDEESYIGKESEQTDSQSKNFEEKKTPLEECEQQSEIKDEPKEGDQEIDELDLAMQNLHDKGIVETEETPKATTEEATNADEAGNTDFNISKGDIDDSKPSEMTAENPENSLETALLDELMTTTAEQSADSSDLAKALKEASENQAIESKTEDDELDSSAKSGLNDLEEFSAIESSESIKEAKETLSPSTLEGTVANVDDIKVETEVKSEKVDNLEDTASTTIAKFNTTSSEWDDIEQDTDDVKGH